MGKKDISNCKLTSSTHLKLKFTVHFFKSPKQTGIISILHILRNFFYLPWHGLSASSSTVFGSEILLRPWQKQYVNHFKFTTLLEYKFGATRKYWIIKKKSSQIQWLPPEYNKSHIQGILKKNGKNTTTWFKELKEIGFQNDGCHAATKLSGYQKISL